MSDALGAAVSALWLGVITSISPCPLATNIAAVSFISRRLGNPRHAIFSGLLYAVGRSACYAGIGILLVAGLLNAPGVSYVLQKHMNRILGPVLVVTGVFLLGLVPVPAFGVAGGDAAQRRAERMGLWGALSLGFLFALAFCPVSAALFFGGLIPLALRNGSPLFLPLLYGAGTALPVVIFAVLIVFGAGAAGRAFRIVDRFEKWARYATAAVFIAVGLHLSFMTILRLDLLAAFR